MILKHCVFMTAHLKSQLFFGLLNLHFNLYFSDWYLVMERIRDHPDFNHFFVEYPGDTTWMEANLFDGDTTGDNRIPWDVLTLPAAEVVFKNIVNQLHAHNHQLE